MAERYGLVTGVDGNMVTVEFEGDISQNEVGFILVGEQRLKSEVIRIIGKSASLQVFEMTGGIGVGDKVEFTGEMLSVELGPGLLTQIYDGLQNPLPELANQCGFFLQRGIYLKPIPDNKWEFTPIVKKGDRVIAGQPLGSVPEGIFDHKIMVPFDLQDGEWVVDSIKIAGTYNVRDEIATICDGKGGKRSLSMIFSWPIKRPITAYVERLQPREPLIIQSRIFDTFLPVA